MRRRRRRRRAVIRRRVITRRLEQAIHRLRALTLRRPPETTRLRPRRGKVLFPREREALARRRTYEGGFRL